MRHAMIGTALGALAAGLIAADPPPRPAPPALLPPLLPNPLPAPLPPPVLPAFDPPPLPAVNSAQVRSLVALLASPDFHARESAGRQIIELGDKALPELRGALKAVEDPEAYRRLEAVVRKLDASRLATARRVGLKADRTPVKEVLADLARQAGYPIHFAGPDNPLITLDLPGAPFWEALDKVADAARLEVTQNEADGSLGVSPSGATNPHVSYAGPFKIVATNVSCGRTLPLSGIPRHRPPATQPEFLNLNLSILSEPKAPLVGVGTPTLIRAVDAAGASLVPVDADPLQTTTSYYGPGGGYRAFTQDVSVNLTRFDRSVTAIKEIRGKVPVAVLSETRPDVTVGEIMDAKKKRFTGRTADLEVLNVDYRNGQLAVDLTIRPRAGDPEEAGWMNGMAQRLEVSDEAGVPFQFGGATNQQNGPNGVTLSVLFAAPENGRKIGLPARLRLVEWVSVTRDVEFVFRNIPLP